MPTNHLKTRNRRVNFSVVLVKTGPALKKAGSFCMNNVYIGNVRKNGWWIFGKRFIKYSRNPEEDASSAGEQLASNKDYHL